MKDATPAAIYLKDYRPPAFLVDAIDLSIDLNEERALVRSSLSMRRNPDAGADVDAPLKLDGQDLSLLRLDLDGKTLNPGDYTLEEAGLTVPEVPESFRLQVVTSTRPQDNTALEGLYKSGGNFCTQCEAEGFRRITFYPDRPDVMARFTTTICADRRSYPVLLSNGNLEARGELEDGRHWVRWTDPFPKPCYLFAMVAGDLVLIEDRFVTASGRDVALHIYVQKQNADKCGHAMRSLKRAMRWDEEVYGREYDLDVYMVVAVDDFNMGAMENKGLNIFNSKYVLAKPDTATDDDFENIEGVIAHEYFHNWSGNRVTLRDWFQLSLKEGFTVFRDQSFTADMTSGAVKRIHDVNLLRTHQFPEDAGPMAHSVRPASYVEINNFYTMTVYEKGAEVVRMLATLLGREAFRRGTDLYFSRHDGQAVTTEDFVKAMEDANGVDLTQFRRWYEQAGTPTLHVRGDYDPAACEYALRIRQSCPPTPGQARKDPFHLPVTVGLLDPEGRALPLRVAGEATEPGVTTRVLELREEEQTFRFVDVPAPPLPSLLRGFSAPVKLEFDYSDADLAFLMAHDEDAYNRWDAGQRLAVKVIISLIEARREGRERSLAPDLVTAARKSLADSDADRRLLAQMLTLPSESYLAELLEPVDPIAIHDARQLARVALAEELRNLLLEVYFGNRVSGSYSLDAEAVGRRKLKNLCLGLLMELADDEVRALCVEQFDNADNMTDRMAALAALSGIECPERATALAKFYDHWQGDPLVIDKWFSIQAISRLPDTLVRVRELMEHPAFNLRNPNRVRSLVGAFCQGNPGRFHHPGGEGYSFLADNVLRLNASNPQIAARLLTPLRNWRRYASPHGELMRAQLQRIMAAGGLSRDVYEIVSKSLG